MMSRHRVTLVIRESVAGLTHVQRPHDTVALDFREDGGSRDAGGLGVALNDGLLRDVDFLQPLRIDQQLLRMRLEDRLRSLAGLSMLRVKVRSY